VEIGVGCNYMKRYPSADFFRLYIDVFNLLACIGSGYAPGLIFLVSLFCCMHNSYRLTRFSQVVSLDNLPISKYVHWFLISITFSIVL
jgi:uncharacterized membrane protein